jgi:hypothetical protein
VVERVIVPVKAESLVAESSSRLAGVRGDFISELAALSAGELIYREKEDFLSSAISFSKD